MFSRPLTDQEVWEALPLSRVQRDQIYNDFILKEKYDKIDNKIITFEDMKDKEDTSSKIHIEVIEDEKKKD